MFAKLAFVASMLTVVITIETVMCDEPLADSKDRPLESLTKAEEILVRRIVYERGLTTATPKEGQWASIRVLVVSKDLSELYTKKPLATIDLLLDIVKGGEPKHAVAATAYAVALLKDIASGAPLARHPTDLVDYVPKDSSETVRDRFVRTVSKLRETIQPLKK